MKSLRSFVQESKRFVVAHRGASGSAPENTLAALRAALDLGVRMAEIDVRLTSDKQVVLLHDHVIGRTTTGSGQTKNMSLAELRSLDAGAWFGEGFSGEQVPLLKEALQLLREHDCYVNIEIKPPYEHEDVLDRIDRIVQIVQEEQMFANTLFGSFHHESLRLLKERYPEAHTSAIQLPQDARLPSEIAAAIGCEAFVCSLRECTHKRCEDALAHGLYVGVYGVDSKEEFEQVMKYPVTALVTNYPELIQQLLREHGDV